MIRLLSPDLPGRRMRFGAALVAVAFAACSAQTAPRSSKVAGLATSGLSFDAGDSVNSSLGDYLAGNFALETGLLAEAATYFERALVRAGTASSRRPLRSSIIALW